MVEDLSGFDQFANDAKEAVCNAYKRAGVLVSAALKRTISRPADAVALDGGLCPMAGDISQPSVHGESSLVQDGLSRPLRDGRNAEVVSRYVQGVPLGAGDGGQDVGSDAGNVPQDFDGAFTFCLLDLVDDLLDSVPGVFDSGVNGFEPSDDSSGVAIQIKGKCFRQLCPAAIACCLHQPVSVTQISAAPIAVSGQPHDNTTSPATS